ncbi:MAG TPA: hypothetical protein PKC20_11485 [Burkholderiaceae bacterium]|nr:hypothetical protein [Burkholderiaceae bacterium]
MPRACGAKGTCARACCSGVPNSATTQRAITAATAAATVANATNRKHLITQRYGRPVGASEDSFWPNDTTKKSQA